MTSVEEATLSNETAIRESSVVPVRPASDRFMRKLLRVEAAQRSAATEASAHRYLRTSMIISGVRCLITYLLIPIAVPIIGLSGAVSAPIGILLSLIAVVTGITSLRKFWVSDHKYRWMYTAFILFVFLVLAVTLTADISKIVSGL